LRLSYLPKLIFGGELLLELIKTLLIFLAIQAYNVVNEEENH
jgi:hypothetical protein